MNIVFVIHVSRKKEIKMATYCKELKQRLKAKMEKQTVSNMILIKDFFEMEMGELRKEWLELSDNDKQELGDMISAWVAS